MRGGLEISPAIRHYLAEQNAVAKSGGYWNCLVAAREICRLLRDEGLSPWIARLRSVSTVGNRLFYAPLIPQVAGISATWTTHYVVCCDDFVYEPLVGTTVPLENYSREVFGLEAQPEVFIADDEMEAYLMQSRLVPDGR